MEGQLNTTTLTFSDMVENKPHFVDCIQIIDEGPSAGRCEPFIKRVGRFHPCHICPEAINDHEAIKEYFGEGYTILHPGFDNIETRLTGWRIEYMRGEITVSDWS
jgi:MoaA/NifB/PqqE/SkfB family radical SAM enzyme